jgi:2-oxoglutarate ferredoxin oxidoreductase subunit alpha
VLDAEALEDVQRFGRYLDVDGDGIGYRTYPGTHPEKGAFFTRGTSRDEFAAYTESPEAYQRNMERLLAKWRTAATLVPRAEIEDNGASAGILYYGTSAAPMDEALDMLATDGIELDRIRVRAFPFGEEVAGFIERHERVFVVDQNRDSQMRTLLINECEFDPSRLVPVRYYAGLSISADTIHQQVKSYFEANRLPRIKRAGR